MLRINRIKQTNKFLALHILLYSFPPNHPLHNFKWLYNTRRTNWKENKKILPPPKKKKKEKRNIKPHKQLTIASNPQRICIISETIRGGKSSNPSFSSPSTHAIERDRERKWPRGEKIEKRKVMEVSGSSNVQISSYKDFNPRIKPVSRPWFSNAELKRKRRVAKYKMYALEGNIKNKWKKGFRWLKKKCSKLVHGY